LLLTSQVSKLVAQDLPRLADAVRYLIKDTSSEVLRRAVAREGIALDATEAALCPEWSGFARSGIDG
jgi:hypothetical protein